jgi:protease I
MNALILAAGGFEDTELLVPYYRLLEEGCEVTLGGPETGPIAGKHGYSVEIRKTCADLAPEDFDLLVLPGGHGPESVRQDPDAVDITRSMMADRKPVAAICHGAQVLISAGVVEGLRATCWPGIADDLKAAGAMYEDAEVVVDGKLVTSRCPSDLPAFCRELLAAARE